MPSILSLLPIVWLVTMGTSLPQGILAPKPSHMDTVDGSKILSMPSLMPRPTATERVGSVISGLSGAHQPTATKNTEPAASSAAPSGQGFPNPQPCRGLCHDPVHGLQDTSVVRRGDGTYFRFSAFNNISIATARSLSGPWQAAGRALPHGSTYPLPGNEVGYWAPDVHEHNGIYYMFYTIQNYHSTPSPGPYHSDVYVATSTDLEHWTDHGSAGIPHNRPTWSNIGANMISEGVAAPYLSWGSFSAGIFGAPLATPPLHVDVPASDPASTHITKLVSDIPLPAFPKNEGNRTEGGYKYAHGGYIYLFYSRGNCCPGSDSDPGEVYRVEVCRALHVDGPYHNAAGRSCLEAPGTLVLGSHGDVVGPGGVGVLTDPAEGPVLFYQYHNRTIGYGLTKFYWGWNHLDFASGWPKVVAQRP